MYTIKGRKCFLTEHYLPSILFRAARPREKFFAWSSLPSVRYVGLLPSIRDILCAFASSLRGTTVTLVGVAFAVALDLIISVVVVRNVTRAVCRVDLLTFVHAIDLKFGGGRINVVGAVAAALSYLQRKGSIFGIATRITP